MTPEARGSRDQPSGASPRACRSSNSSSENAARTPFSGSSTTEGITLFRGLFKPQRAAAEAADWTRRHFEDEHVRLLRARLRRAGRSGRRVHAALGVNRSVPQADGRGRRADRFGNPPCLPGGHGRRRDVQGFLEEWTVERIGLVEEGEHVQRTVMHQSFKRKLAAGDEAFDQEAVVRWIAFGAHVRPTQKRAQPVERNQKLVGIVGADDAAAARQRNRLDDTRKRQRSRQLARIRVDSRGEKPRHRKTGVAKPLARALLVACGCSRPGGMDGEIERRGGSRGDDRRPVAKGNDSVEPTCPRRVDDRLDRSVLIMKPDGDGAILPRIFQHVASIGREDQLDAKLLGGVTEGTRLIARRRR